MMKNPDILKVLMFGWEFPPHISGGLGTACYGLTRGLAGFSDVEVTFVVPKTWGDEDRSFVSLFGAGCIPVVRRTVQFKDAISKVEYYELQSDLIPYLGTSEYDELKTRISSGEKRLVETDQEGRFSFSGDYGPGLFQEIRNYTLVAETLARELDFDVIHVHDWMTFAAGVAVKRISGKPLVVHVHSTEFDRSGTGVDPAICAVEKDGLDAADQVIAVSEFTRDILLRKYHVGPEKVITVYNAAEPVFSPEVAENDRPEGEKTVSFLGRITMQKGPEYFVDAASLVLQRMKNVKFILAGKGDRLNAMISRAAALGLSDQFSFPGFLNSREVGLMFRNSDVFVMPSVSEPFGIVALEAMQAGVAVIISKQSGVSEVVNNAFKVDYWDIRTMADAICYLLGEDAFRKNMAAAAKKEVDQLRWEATALQVRELYFRLV